MSRDGLTGRADCVFLSCVCGSETKSSPIFSVDGTFSPPNVRHSDRCHQTHRADPVQLARFDPTIIRTAKVLPLPYFKGCTILTSLREKTEYCSNCRERDAKDYNEQGHLQPDKSTNFSKYKLNSRSPWWRNCIAQGLDAVLEKALGSGQSLRLLVERRDDEDPSQDHRERAKRVNFQMVTETRSTAVAKRRHQCHRI